MKSASFYALLALIICSIASMAAFADEILPPPDHQNWGDPNGTNDLLNMNHDPNFVRKADPGDIKAPSAKQNCTDSKGQTFKPDDAGYQRCENDSSNAKVMNAGSAPYAKPNPSRVNGAVMPGSTGMSFGGSGAGGSSN